MSDFLGFFGSSVGNVAAGIIQTANDAAVPVDADIFPTFKIYEAGGTAMANGTGTAVYLEEKAITGATNASPIVITSAGHGLLTGMRVTVSGVLGNTNANGSWTVTVIDANTFSLQGSTGNGTYTGGGLWHRVGLYKWSKTLNVGDGYAAGKTYIVVGNALVTDQQSIQRAVTDADTFQFVG
jgi:hypothetical protein